MRFRRKPVPLEAMLYFQDDSNHDEVAAWCGGTYRKALANPRSNAEDWPTAIVLNGVEIAIPGFWLLKDPYGRISACSDGEFKELYEPIL